MDIVGWLWWGITKAISLVLGIAWFLVGGWVSALAQIGVVVLVIYGFKYGWQRAPFEIVKAAKPIGRLAWGWVRAREPAAATAGGERVRDVVRTVRVKEPGDVNLSTLLSLVMLFGFVIAIVAPALR
jgi:hypothetical protein